MLALHEQRNIQNALFSEESFGKNQRCRSFTERVTVAVPTNYGSDKLYCLKACKISKVRARCHEVTNKPCTSLNYENTPSYKKINDYRTSKMRQTTCNWIGIVIKYLSVTLVSVKIS